MPESYWFGSREHLPLVVTDDGVAVDAFDVAVVRSGVAYADASWSAAQVYAGKRGVWLDGLAGVGVYRVFARYGAGAPNERVIVHCGDIIIRDK